ncbi:FAD-dependent oxidoreductase [Microcoleus vaginatus]|uniref:FAD-dependent oxidoreductase n=1 Tax=Microcoleus vaginatus TaxID=119532 RepID=UPI00168A04C3|nr:NAD(P)/FAD-dependent oxidoreductase [Microcoleus sp. FACHB-84]MBD2009270.1 NAD(P)/FAD-dependent oxidoreductase [Microcoleus sp. FACHB-45]
MKHYPVAIVGAGPAGLTAAYELVKQGIIPVVLEKGDKVGGIARTETYKGYRFDIGGHRFYTKVEAVQQLWQEVLGNEFIKVPRLSRIFYRGKFFNYPISAFNTLFNLGIIESALIILSYLKVRIWPLTEEKTFEQWVINRFGERLYKTFFKTYTEKVWGIPCSEIQADWAAQRIKGLSLTTAIINALFGSNDTKTLIKEFDYPALGPGMMWEKFAEAVENKDGKVYLDTKVISFEREGNKIKSITAEQNGELVQYSADNFITSMPISALVARMKPQPPEEVLHAARSLKYRDFLIVSLIVNRKDLFPDNWIYIHSPEVKVGRIQNFKNWSAALVPDASKSCLGMEYFCSVGDEVWEMSDAQLIELATRELVGLGLATTAEVEDGVVIRQPKAYPVYDGEYRGHLQVLEGFVKGIENLQTIGRNGMHRYNNQDHSMLTGMLAVRNILGEKHDLWDVNTERSYYEDFSVDRSKEKKDADLISQSI